MPKAFLSVFCQLPNGQGGLEHKSTKFENISKKQNKNQKPKNNNKRVIVFITGNFLQISNWLIWSQISNWLIWSQISNWLIWSQISKWLIWSQISNWLIWSQISNWLIWSQISNWLISSQISRCFHEVSNLTRKIQTKKKSNNIEF